MKMAAFRKVTTLIMTLVMLMTCMTAWATETADSGENKTFDHSVIEVTVAPNDATAVQVNAAASGDASMTVTEDVSALADINAANDSANATGADVKADNGNTATLDVGENVSAETFAEGSGAYGARVKVGEDSTAVLNTGLIEATAHSDNSSAEGLELFNDPGGTIKVETDGVSATAEGKGSYAEAVVLYELTENSKTEINVGKDGISAAAGEEGGSALGFVGPVFGDVVLTSEGDITAKAADYSTGVGQTVYKDSSFTMESKGSVEAATSGDGAYCTGVSLTALDESTANVSIGEKVSAQSEGKNSDVSAVVLYAGQNSSVSLETGSIETVTKGDGTAAESVVLRNEPSSSISLTTDGISATNEGDNSYAEGIVFYELTEGGKVEINVGKDGISTTANGENSDALTVVGQVFGDVAVNSEGDIIAAGTNQSVGISTTIYPDSSLTVHVGGGVQATTGSKDSETMAVRQMLMGGQTNISVDQDVTAAGGKTALGINVETYNEEALANISVGGDITAKDAQRAFAIDVTAAAGTIKVKTGGDVSAISDGYAAIGVYAWGSGDEDTTVNVEGGVSAFANALDDGHGYSTGIQADADTDNDKISITVGDGVKAETAGNTDAAIGIFTRSGDEFNANESGKIEIQVIGDVESSGTGIKVTSTERDYLYKTTTVDDSEYDHSEYVMVEGVGIYEDKIYYNAEGDYYYNESGDMWKQPEDIGSGLTRIEVKGDVNAGNIGLDVSGEVPADIIIDGTLEGKNHAVVLNQESVADNLTLTVWEIKPNADGSVAEYGQIDANGELQTTEATDVEKEIQYIIRLEQPQSGGTLSTVGTFEYEGYTVAHEGDTVILKINLEPGYEIVDAYNGTDIQVSLLQDANGEYYLVVPRGGAVLLSVKLRKIVKKQAAAKNCTIIIDPNGGTMNGSTEPVIETVGRFQSITLPEATEKKGETFLGWYGTPFAATNANWKAPEADSDKLLPAGGSVKVTRDYFYTAVWKVE